MSEEPIDCERREYPPWRQAVKAFLEKGWTYGDVIPHQWLYDVLQIRNPHQEPIPDFHTGMQLLADYARQVQSLVRELEQEHKKSLLLDEGVGYRVLHPHEQAGVARRKCRQQVRHAIGKAASTMFNVDLTALGEENKSAHLRLANHFINAQRFFAEGMEALDGKKIKQEKKSPELPRG